MACLWFIDFLLQEPARLSEKKCGKFVAVICVGILEADHFCIPPTRSCASLRQQQRRQASLCRFHAGGEHGNEKEDRGFSIDSEGMSSEPDGVGSAGVNWVYEGNAAPARAQLQIWRLASRSRFTQKGRKSIQSQP